MTFVGDSAVQQQAANDLLYTILALNTSGRAKQIVKENMGRNGVEAWVRLRERFGKTTGATTYVDIFSSIGRAAAASRTSGGSGSIKYHAYCPELCPMRQRRLWRSKERQPQARLRWSSVFV